MAAHCAAVGGGGAAFAAALGSMGIPKDSIIRYETSLKASKFLLMAHGTVAETERARALLSEMGVDDLEVHTRAA